MKYGRKAGQREGLKQGKREVAVNALRNGTTGEFAALITGFSEEEIAKIQQDIISPNTMQHVQLEKGFL